MRHENITSSWEMEEDKKGLEVSRFYLFILILIQCLFSGVASHMIENLLVFL